MISWGLLSSLSSALAASCFLSHTHFLCSDSLPSLSRRARGLSISLGLVLPSAAAFLLWSSDPALFLDRPFRLLLLWLPRPLNMDGSLNVVPRELKGRYGQRKLLFILNLQLDWLHLVYIYTVSQNE